MFYRLLFPFLVIKFLLRKRYDVIHIFWGKALSLAPFLLRKAAVVWVDDVRSGHIGNRFSSIVINFFIVLESVFFDRILTLDERLYKKIWQGLPFGDSLFKSKVFYVPMGVDTELFTRSYDQELASSLGINPQDKVFIYVGTLVRSRKMGNFIKAFSIALKKLPNLKLIMVGKGDDEPYLRCQVKDLGLQDRVKFVGPVLYHLVPKYVSLGSFGVSYVPQTSNFENQQVTKSLEYLSCGLPVLGTKIPFHLDVIGEKEGVLTDDRPEDVAEGVIKIIELEKKGQFKDKPTVHNQYSWSYIVKNCLLPAYLGKQSDKNTR
jgi:glycosyltransferase involved in cell wall biosynthesis